jgi:hypothetical protein
MQKTREDMVKISLNSVTSNFHRLITGAGRIREPWQNDTAPFYASSPICRRQALQPFDDRELRPVINLTGRDLPVR